MKKRTLRIFAVVICLAILSSVFVGCSNNKKDLDLAGMLAEAAAKIDATYNGNDLKSNFGFDFAIDLGMDANKDEADFNYGLVAQGNLNLTAAGDKKSNLLLELKDTKANKSLFGMYWKEDNLYINAVVDGKESKFNMGAFQLYTLLRTYAGAEIDKFGGVNDLFDMILPLVGGMLVKDVERDGDKIITKLKDRSFRYDSKAREYIFDIDLSYVWTQLGGLLKPILTGVIAEKDINSILSKVSSGTIKDWDGIGTFLTKTGIKTSLVFKMSYDKALAKTDKAAAKAAGEDAINLEGERLQSIFLRNVNINDVGTFNLGITKAALGNALAVDVKMPSFDGYVATKMLDVNLEGEIKVQSGFDAANNNAPKYSYFGYVIDTNIDPFIIANKKVDLAAAELADNYLNIQINAYEKDATGAIINKNNVVSAIFDPTGAKAAGLKETDLIYINLFGEHTQIKGTALTQIYDQVANVVVNDATNKPAAPNTDTEINPGAASSKMNIVTLVMNVLDVVMGSADKTAKTLNIDLAKLVAAIPDGDITLFGSSTNGAALREKVLVDILGFTKDKDGKFVANATSVTSAVIGLPTFAYGNGASTGSKFDIVKELYAGQKDPVEFIGLVNDSTGTAVPENTMVTLYERDSSITNPVTFGYITDKDINKIVGKCVYVAYNKLVKTGDVYSLEKDYAKYQIKSVNGFDAKKFDVAQPVTLVLMATTTASYSVISYKTSIVLTEQTKVEFLKADGTTVAAFAAEYKFGDNIAADKAATVKVYGKVKGVETLLFTYSNPKYVIADASNMNMVDANGKIDRFNSAKFNISCIVDGQVFKFEAKVTKPKNDTAVKPFDAAKVAKGSRVLDAINGKVFSVIANPKAATADQVKINVTINYNDIEFVSGQKLIKDGKFVEAGTVKFKVNYNGIELGTHSIVIE